MSEETPVAEASEEQKPVYGNISAEELEKPEYSEEQMNEMAWRANVIPGHVVLDNLSLRVSTE